MAACLVVLHKALPECPCSASTCLFTVLFSSLIINLQCTSMYLFGDLGKLFLRIYLFAPRIRVSTWNRLNLLRSRGLSATLRQAMAHDPVAPVLTDAHLAALDRRLLGVLATIQQCMEAQGADNTLIEDRMNLPHP